MTEADWQVLNKLNTEQPFFLPRQKCTIPCGSVGMMHRERIPESMCTWIREIKEALAV